MNTNVRNQYPSALDECLTGSRIAGLPEPYRGKVRDVYTLDEEHIGIVVTDRISAFDHIMRQSIPFKGQILNRLAAFSFEKTADIISNHIVELPHPNVTIAKRCRPIPVEVVIRGYLTGHAWRTYRSGIRTLCGVPLPEGLREHERFEKPILTPATKATEGHDEDISESEILERGIVSETLWREIRTAAFRLFERGSELAAARGLILVDTKYEFGLHDGELTLIDEVHTSDSSRYFYADGYRERLDRSEPQRQLSKEFVREWLMDHGFQGLEGQQLPDLPDHFRWEVYERYSELYRTLTGEPFLPKPTAKIDDELAEVFTRWRTS